MADVAIPTAVLREMIGDELMDALLAARTRLSDDTIIVRCEQCLWIIERAAVQIDAGLDYAGAVAALGALA